MAIGNEYADNLKRELLTEMADNFFARRRRLDEQLERFAALQERMARRGHQALGLWRAFRRLLLAGEEADVFLSELGFDVPTLLAYPAVPETTARVRYPWLAISGAGRYRKTVFALYDRLRQELEAYNEGSYATDPHDPRRMVRIPGYESFRAVGDALNTEIAAVNASQNPSDMLHFTKTLDPTRQEQESACGGAITGAACSLDRDMAFALLDLDAVGVPFLPTPPPAADIEAPLSDLADRLYRADPLAAKSMVKAVTR